MWVFFVVVAFTKPIRMPIRNQLDKGSNYYSNSI